MRCLLHVVHPPEVAGVVELRTQRTTLGRRPGPEQLAITISHSTVSRAHAAVEWSPGAGAHVLWDLGSSNGTWVDGARLGADPWVLDHGAVVRLGDVLAVYERAPDDATAFSEAVSVEEIPGVSAGAISLRTQVALAGMDPSPVLVLGETGAGKERIAAEIHRLSGRNGRYCAVNCAALAPTLVESQLFGHVKGAFTGATAAQKGLFRDSDGGSLFLDEVGELPLELQAKLLRVIQEREVMPLGSSHTYRVDVRVIAATNADLIGRVENGGFRRDLYARLAMWEVVVPPLRSRRPDVLAWTDRLFERWGSERGLDEPGALRWSPTAAQRLLLARWKDNLRGVDRLVHAVAHRAVQRQPIDVVNLPAWLGELPATVSESAAAPAPIRAAAKPPAPDAEQLRSFLESNGWSVRGAARHYQRDRRQIYRWIERYGIEKPQSP